MKKNDIAMIILIASVSAMFAYFIGRTLIGDPESRAVQVKTVEAISTDVERPDATVFNKNAINPTVEINIGNSSNQQPFGG
jgi:hypothetical protein